MGRARGSGYSSSRHQIFLVLGLGFAGAWVGGSSSVSEKDARVDPPVGWLERRRCRSRLTFRTRHVLSQFVQLLRKCLAVWTVALWLLATQHCGLESAGVLAQSCEQPGGQHDCGTGTHVDGCQVVEGA